MRAAQIVELGKPPKAVELEGEAEGPIEIAAVALNPLDLAVAAGRFYGGHPPLRYAKTRPRKRAASSGRSCKRRHRAGRFTPEPDTGSSGHSRFSSPGWCDPLKRL